MAFIRNLTFPYLILFFANLSAGHASGFLTMQQAAKSLESELSPLSKGRVSQFKEALQDTYAALPKNAAGHLEHQTVRYVLHRLFVQRHGWFIRGLEPGGDVWYTTASQESLKDWVPSYMLGRLEERVGSRGIDLGDLAALAAALEDLVQQEIVGRLKDAYNLRGLPVEGKVSLSQAQEGTTTFLALYLGANLTSSTAEEYSEAMADFENAERGWADAQTWLRGVEVEYLPGQGRDVPFAAASRVAMEVSARFSTYNDKECKGLKSTLLGMRKEGAKEGRVSLADFYEKGEYSHWDFDEKIEYLQALGAIDDSDANSPMVIIPNYVGSRPNCLDATHLYDVCCPNECEDLMGHLERHIAASSASPSRIIELVSALKSDTVSAPRQLSPDMVNRLEDMAVRHGGQVNLHGRLFAQWMHHAFPNECPFPHVAGTSSPVTPDEWIGLDVKASEEERKAHVSSRASERAAGTPDLPWSNSEELLGERHFSLREVEQSLEAELKGVVSKERLQQFRDALQTTYAALPKNSAGHLEHQTVRYVLHRLFVQRHGWFIKGLEPGGDVWHTTVSEESLKNWVPSYMLDRLEERVGSRGVDLNDLAALGAALEDLIRNEVSGRMTDMYRLLAYDKSSTLTREQTHKVLNSYLTHYLSGGNYTFEIGGADEAIEEFKTIYTDWAEAETWASTIERKHSSGNTDFATVARIAEDIGASFSDLNDKECKDLKRTLLSMQGESKRAGRIYLTDFYKKGLYSHWNFDEKIDYLRAIGALDESNPSVPMVIMPNYIGSRSNCLTATSLYDVCCRNECEDLMGHLESKIAAPTAAPDLIVELVSSFGSDTVVAPRQLPHEMVTRLEDMAKRHGGKVNLHGRLFAQWMHHLFPNECPYPHEAGMSDPVTPDEWMGNDSRASEEDRQKYIEAVPIADDSVGLHWSGTEELLGSRQLTMQAAERTLEAELKGAVSKTRVPEFKTALAATYTALPKNFDGHLNHQTVRYVLHRLFVQRHGWFIKGLEPDGDVWHSKSNDSVKDWVPSYLLERLEARLGSRGIDLGDLAALAAALEDLVREDAVERLRGAYSKHGFGMDDSLTKDQAEKVITTYLVMYLATADITLEEVEGFPAIYTGWEQVDTWVREIQLRHLETSDGMDFSLISRVALDIDANYSYFNDGECRDLKKVLMSIKGSKVAGRVRLADYYNKGFYSHWDFTEKMDYLRAIGALDESKPNSPMVIVSNYLAARPNCLQATNLYDVCCRNECEDLMGHLERNLAAPTASVDRIADLVSALSSDTVSAPRRLAPDLLSRLREMSVVHGGSVNLHGRLFAQWMHHVFPYECPYPHEAGSTSPLTPDEWIGVSVGASEEERRKVIEADTCAADSSGCDGPEEPLPWSQAEELLAASAWPEQNTDEDSNALIWLLCVGALLSFPIVMVLSHPAGATTRAVIANKLEEKDIPWQLPALSVVALVLYALNLVNLPLLVFAIIGGLVANFAKEKEGKGGKGCGKDYYQDKCCV